MFLLGILLTLSGLLYLAFGALRNHAASRKEWTIFALFFVGGLCFMSVTLVPPQNWDLYRHYELIQNMTLGGWRYIFTGSIYTHLPVINLLYGLISFTGIPQLLVVFVLCACYGILAYIISDCSKSEKIDSRFIACAILFNLALCPLLHVVSGVRNVLAFAICALAFHNELVHKSKTGAFLWYVTALFIHPASILIILLRLIFPIFLKMRWLGIFLLFWSFLADLAASVLQRLPVAFLQDIGWKLKDYIENREFSGYKILLIKLVFLLSILLVARIATAHEKNVNLQRYTAALELVILFIVGSFKVVFIADRLCFFVAFFAIPVLSYIYTNYKGRLRPIFILECIGVGGLLFIHQLQYFISAI